MHLQNVRDFELCGASQKAKLIKQDMSLCKLELAKDMAAGTFLIVLFMSSCLYL